MIIKIENLKMDFLSKRSLKIFFISLFLFSLLRAGVYIDQAGYPPDAPKFVFSSQFSDSFYVINSESGQTVFSGELETWKINDPATGYDIYRGDFSAVKREGDYHILTKNGSSSATFRIEDSVYNDVYRKALRAFYFQRCGIALEAQFAGEYAHPRCHSTDAFFHESTGLSGYQPTAGGWHDAGDYGKYVVNAGITLGTMLMAYDYFPDHFNQDDLNIPESGNGIPDILDEVAWELDWLLSMQDSSGGVFFKVTREQFAPFIIPQDDKSPRYIYQISSTATADFAAVTARAAAVMKPFREEFSARLLSASRRAWNYLENNPDIVPAGGFKNPEGTATGEYGDSNDRDERLWAAAELFNTTGEAQYHAYYAACYADQGLFNQTMAWPNVKVLAHLTYLRSRTNGVSEKIRSELKNSLNQYCTELLAKCENSGFQVALQPGEYAWGSNSVPLNRAILLITAFEETRNKNFLNTAADQLHYILGANAHNLSFVTSIGTNYPHHPHHRPSAADDIGEPVPGLLAGGPDQYLDDAVLRSRFTSETPPALCYADHQESYASNEICINWNAPLVFVAGYFNSGDFSQIPDSGENNIPETIRLWQNYPNPFNSATTLYFSLPVAKPAQLNIYDVQGKAVYQKSLGLLPAGENRFVWSGIDLQGRPAASGIYFF
ncbi:MAG: glycoside hydrolase family 9 protein, partial [Calditrichia bacterium]